MSFTVPSFRRAPVVYTLVTEAPLAKQAPSVTTFPQVGDVLTVKQPGPESGVSPDNPGRNPTP